MKTMTRSLCFVTALTAAGLTVAVEASAATPAMVLDELTTSEALMPFFLPNPGTTLEKLRQ